MSRIERRTLYYWDTSALIKRYATEPGTMEVDLLIDGPINTHWIAALLAIEVHTTLHKKVGDGTITPQQRSQALSDFVLDATTKPYEAIEVTDADYAEAIRLADTHAFTGAGDALIVAVGVRVFRIMRSDLVWVTCDREMREAVNAEGFDVYDPQAAKFHTANGRSYRSTPA